MSVKECNMADTWNTVDENITLNLLLATKFLEELAVL